RELGREGARHVDLVEQFRHSRPRAENVRRVMRLKQREVIRPQVLRIADLHRVAKMTRDGAQEGIEPRQEVGRPGKGGFGERAELEDQGRDPVAVAFQRPGELFVEQTVVQEALVRGASTRAVPGVAGPSGHCDFFRNLETELEGWRRLVEKLLPVRRGGELVEAEVAANYWE